MAFGSDNDIQIKVTLDTADAVKGVEALKQSIKTTLDLTKSQFLRLAEISKEFNRLSIEQIKAQKEVELAKINAQEEQSKQRHERELARIALEAAKNKLQFESIVQAAAIASAEEIKIAQIKANELKKLRDIERKETAQLGEQAVRTAQSAAKVQVEQQREANLKIIQETASIYQETARIRKRGSGNNDGIKLGNTAGAGKELTAFGNTLLAVGVQVGRFNISVGSIVSSLGGLSNPFAIASAAIGGYGIAIGKALSLSNDLAGQAAKVEGFATAFDTLQRSVGRNPSESIETLRKATQGLISDTELYQRANQALLLNVPASLFEKSAEAAVKLGRAMGIDAANAIESLSIGLGRQSRLYLDNLGIVVSAEEAYQNFAAANNKLVSNLTEGEKRLAFFTLTAKKLEEGLATLPPIQDTVGTQFTKLQSSLSNANNAFLNGFNQSDSLATTYADLKTEVDKLQGAFEKLGNVYANLLGFIISNPLSKAIISGVADFVDEAATILGKRFGDSLESQIFRADQALKKAESELKQVQESGFNQRQLASGDIVKEDYVKRVEAARAGLAALQEQQRKLAEAPPVAIKIDTTEISNFAANTSAALDKVRQNIGEGLGKIEVPGLNQTQISAGIEQAKLLGAQIENTTISADEAQKSVAGIFTSLAEAAKNVNISVIDKQIELLDKNSKDYRADLEKLKKVREAYQSTLAIEPRQVEQINAAIQKGLQLGKEKAQEDSKNAKKRSDEFAAQLKKQKQEIDSFLKAVSRRADTAIPPQIKKRIQDLFKSADVGTAEFSSGLVDIAQETINLNGDLRELERTTQDYFDLLAQGVPKEALPEIDIAKSSADYNDALSKIQGQMINLREIFSGKNFDPKTGMEQGGGFFGYKLLDATTEEARQAEAQLAGVVQSSLSTAFQAGVDGFSKEDAPAVGGAIGAAIGGAIGFYLGSGAPWATAAGASVGSAVGSAVGEGLFAAERTVKDDVNDFFKEVLDGGRIAIIINKQIVDAAGAITVQPIIDAINKPLGRNGVIDVINAGFAPERFAALSSQVQSYFTAAGNALGALVGAAKDQIPSIVLALSDTLQGSLQNLQVVLQQSGKSFEEFAALIYKSFINTNISISEAYNALLKLQGLFTQGIPDAVGAWDQAIKNSVMALDSGGQQFIDSIRDIGAEGIEAGASFESVINQFAIQLGLSGNQIQLLFEALRSNGITTLDQLSKVGVDVAIRFGEQINLIKDGVAQTVADINIPKLPPMEGPKAPSGPKKKSPEEIRKELLKKQTEEARNLVKESQNYLSILNQINQGLLTRVAAGKEIVALEKQILDAIKVRDAAEKALNAELDRGSKANAKNIARLASKLKEAEDLLAKLSEKASEASSNYNKLDISGILPLIKSINTLGVVSRQIGVDLQKNVDILIKGFLQGRLSISEVNDEIKKTKDILGPGIPNAIGDVTGAFQNLINAGKNGGQFSVDAFLDIFAEFREKFEKEGSALRKAQENQLRANLDAARAIYEAAVGPEATDVAKKSLDLAKKALDDFYSNVPAPDLSDLRQQLAAAFGSDQTDIFFKALDESGLRTFEDLANAGAASVVGILGKLEELGFKFNETTGDIKKINDGLKDAEKNSNNGLDPLQEAIDLVRQFNSGASTLPPTFDATTEAIDKLNKPLAKLANGFDSIIKKLALLSGQTFENDVVFNIRTVGDQGSKGLVEILFGNGSGVSSGTGNGQGGSSKRRGK